MLFSNTKKKYIAHMQQLSCTKMKQSAKLKTHLNKLNVQFASKRSRFCPILQLIVVNTEWYDLIVSNTTADFSKYVETVNDGDLTVQNDVEDLHMTMQTASKVTCENICLSPTFRQFSEHTA